MNGCAWCVSKYLDRGTNKTKFLPACQAYSASGESFCRTARGDFSFGAYVTAVADVATHATTCAAADALANPLNVVECGNFKSCSECSAKGCRWCQTELAGIKSAPICSTLDACQLSSSGGLKQVGDGTCAE